MAQQRVKDTEQRVKAAEQRVLAGSEAKQGSSAKSPFCLRESCMHRNTCEEVPRGTLTKMTPPSRNTDIRPWMKDQQDPEYNDSNKWKRRPVLEPNVRNSAGVQP